MSDEQRKDDEIEVEGHLSEVSVTQEPARGRRARATWTLI